MSWWKFLKWSFWSHLLLFYTTTNHFSIGLWSVMKTGFYATTSLVVEPREAPRHFPKPDLHQRKVMVTIWWSAAYLIHYSFLSLGEIITSAKYAQQINEMHQKLQCLQPALVNGKGPILLHNNAWLHITQPTLQKLNKLGYKVSALPPHIHLTSHQLTTTSSSILTTVLQRKSFYNKQETENAFQEFVEL